MKIVTYQCDWTNEWIAYDDNYSDEFTPHGIGSTLDEAIEDLKNIMDQYFNCPVAYDAWLSELSSYGA